jgi:hypothetical protein
MKWRRDKPPPVPLIEGETLNLKALSPKLAATLKTCLGKLDRSDFDPVEMEQVQALYDVLGGASYTIVVKGLFGDYGAPVEYIKAIPPNPKRK